MAHGMKVGFGAGHIVLDGDPAGYMDQDATWYGVWPRPTAHCVGLCPGHIVLDGHPSSPPPKGHSPQFSADVCCGQTVGWIKMPLGREVGLGHGHISLDGDPAPLPNFRPMSIVDSTVLKLWSQRCSVTY